MNQAQPPSKENPYRRSLLRRQHSVDTRRRIVRTAARLWAENGYESTTVEDICAAAGIARSTYYFHFESKRQVLIELTFATASATAADVERTLEAGGLSRQVEAFIDGLSRRMESVPRDLAALVLRQAIVGVEHFGDHRDGTVDFAVILERILDLARKRGEIRGDVDVAEYGAILGGMTMEALLRWATGRTRSRSLRESLEMRINLVVDSLRT